VVGRVNVTGQRERTLALAVERFVPRRRLDPIVEPHLLKVHIHRIPLADLLFRFFLRPHRMADRPFAAPHHSFQRALFACKTI